MSSFKISLICSLRSSINRFFLKKNQHNTTTISHRSQCQLVRLIEQRLVLTLISDLSSNSSTFNFRIEMNLFFAFDSANNLRSAKNCVYTLDQSHASQTWTSGVQGSVAAWLIAEDLVCKWLKKSERWLNTHTHTIDGLRGNSQVPQHF